MAQNQFERELASVDYADGDATIDLPRSHYFERLAVLVDYDVNIGSTNDDQNGAGILELIDGLTVTLNGNQTVKKTDFAMSHFIDQYQYGTQPVLDRLDHTTAADQTGQIATFIDFTIRPGDLSAMLPAFETSDFTLDVSWGDDTDIADDATINSATATVTSTERLRKSVASSRSKEERILSNLMVYKERQKRKVLDSTGVTPIELPQGNVYYATPFRVYDADAPDNDLVDRFSIVEDGVETHKDVGFDQARARDVTEYGFSVDDLPTGFVYPNFGLKGDLDDVVATQGMDSFELQVDTDQTAPTSPAEVQLVTQELIR